MEAEIITPPAVPTADLPLMSITSPPRSTEGLVKALRPLIVIVLSLYYLPGLFSDPTAQALVETCGLDTYIDGGF